MGSDMTSDASTPEAASLSIANHDKVSGMSLNLASDYQRRVRPTTRSITKAFFGYALGARLLITTVHCNGCPFAARSSGGTQKDQRYKPRLARWEHKHEQITVKTRLHTGFYDGLKSMEYEGHHCVLAIFRNPSANAQA